LPSCLSRNPCAAATTTTTTAPRDPGLPSPGLPCLIVDNGAANPGELAVGRVRKLDSPLGEEHWQARVRSSTPVQVSAPRRVDFYKFIKKNGVMAKLRWLTSQPLRCVRCSSSSAEPWTGRMQNDAGEVVDLYLPRKWYVPWSSRGSPGEPRERGRGSWRQPAQGSPGSRTGEWACGGASRRREPAARAGGASRRREQAAQGGGSGLRVGTARQPRLGRAARVRRVRGAWLACGAAAGGAAAAAAAAQQHSAAQRSAAQRSAAQRSAAQRSAARRSAARRVRPACPVRRAAWLCSAVRRRGRSGLLGGFCALRCVFVANLFVLSQLVDQPSDYLAGQGIGAD
jgi:hypothetical protein